MALGSLPLQKATLKEICTRDNIKMGSIVGKVSTTGATAIITRDSGKIT